MVRTAHLESVSRFGTESRTIPFFLQRKGVAWYAGEYRSDKDCEGGVGNDGGSGETGKCGSAAVAQNDGDHGNLQESGHHVEHHAAQDEINACICSTMDRQEIE